MKNTFLKSIFIFVLMLTTSYAEVANKLKVEGNNRISEETILMFSDETHVEWRKENLQHIGALINQQRDTRWSPKN